MRSLAQRVMTAIAATATIIALTAVPAFATPFTGSNTQAVVAYDAMTGSLLACSSSSLAGDAPSPPGSLLVITSASFSSCVVTGSFPVNVTAISLPWDFIAGNPLDQLTGFALVLDVPSIGCTVTISAPGDISGIYTSGTPNILDLDDNDLVVSSATAMCPSSLFNVGDALRLKAQYEVS
ncbi:hypothetical protein [Spirillospora sp. NPDC048819]|uniref:hypothetical protein n=1 Tax=Spirillospora sp. NPDC048819 TaxID=3155268 RepID=UPI0033E144C8